MNTYGIVPTLAAVMLVSACADMTAGLAVGPHQETANALRPAADPFQQALVEGYRKLAAEQYYAGNYRSADRFYLKAIDAAAGKSVVMEEPAFWTTPNGMRTEGLHGADLQAVVETRAQMMPWIAATKINDPQTAAAQQVKFDCWIEEMSEQQYAEAAACRPAYRQVAAVAAPAMPAPFAPAPQAAAVDPCTLNPNGFNQNGTLCKISIINFGFDRYDLLQAGETAIDRQTAAEQATALDLIVLQANAIKAARIDVMGRTDASGAAAYNYGLSDCRAQSVVAALRARGLPASVETQIVPLGKTDLIVPTEDGVREAKNRVVMVAYHTNRNAPSAARPEPTPTQDVFGCGTSSRHPFPPRG